MKTLNHWLLPKGVEEILPKQAWLIDKYQRKVLDIYHAWGYELVIPPMIEYQESLHVGFGEDIDLLSFKVTDQMSGRTLALRADITPQAARIDAHSWRREGPTRLCYCGTVLHTKPKTEFASRTPIEVGAELYGDASISSDAEVINLMLSSIRAADVEQVFLDLGHVDIYGQLLTLSGLDEKSSTALFEAFDRKSETEVDEILLKCKTTDSADMLKSLLQLNGGLEVVEKARVFLANAPTSIHKALNYLEAVTKIITRTHPSVAIHLDLAELRGFRYHTGLIFAAYIDGVGHAVANGGRYDGIGKLFGRERPATGFSINVNALLKHIVQQPEQTLILAPPVEEIDKELQALIDKLRQKGKRVVHTLTQAGEPINCNQRLIQVDGQWQVSDMNAS